MSMNSLIVATSVKFQKETERFYTVLDSVYAPCISVYAWSLGSRREDQKELVVQRQWTFSFKLNKFCFIINVPFPLKLDVINAKNISNTMHSLF